MRFKLKRFSKLSMLICVCCFFFAGCSLTKPAKSIPDEAWSVSGPIEIQQQVEQTLQFVTANLQDESITLSFHQTEEWPETIDYPDAPENVPVRLAEQQEIANILLTKQGTEAQPILFVLMKDGSVGYVDILLGMEDFFTFPLCMLTELHGVNHFQLLGVDTGDAVNYTVLAVLDNESAVDIAKYM